MGENNRSAIASDHTSLLGFIVVAGIAGRFTRQHLGALRECAGPKGIAYMTSDHQVGCETLRSDGG